jgi:hypothetical protein
MTHALLATLALTAAPASGAPTLARQFIDQLAAGNFSTAGAQFTPQMAQSLTPDKLALLWHGLESRKGTFQKVVSVSDEHIGDGTAELLSCRFAKAPMTFEVFVDGSGHIGGFFLTSASIVARRLITRLSKGDVAGAFGLCDPTLRKALPQPKLAALWSDLVAQSGAFRGIDQTKVEPAEDNWATIATVGFANRSVILRVVVDGEGRVIGFFRQ